MTSRPPAPADPRPIPPADTAGVHPDEPAVPQGLPPVLGWLDVNGADCDGPFGPGSVPVAEAVAAAVDGLAGLDLDRLSGRQLLDVVAILGPVVNRLGMT